MYKPGPMNTQNITLTEDLQKLTEELARNVHENWAAQRIAEGWVYGEVRDDKKKTTPCLIPYDELTEAEKEYDRNTAIQTLKMIMVKGYKVEKSEK